MESALAVMRNDHHLKQWMQPYIQRWTERTEAKNKSHKGQESRKAKIQYFFHLGVKKAIHPHRISFFCLPSCYKAYLVTKSPGLSFSSKIKWQDSREVWKNERKWEGVHFGRTDGCTRRWQWKIWIFNQIGRIFGKWKYLGNNWNLELPSQWVLNVL